MHPQSRVRFVSKWFSLSPCGYTSKRVFRGRAGLIQDLPRAVQFLALIKKNNTSHKYKLQVSWQRCHG